MSISQKDFFLGAVVGATLATLSTLLVTTKKGKQLQHKIGSIFEDTEDNLKEAFSKAKGEVKETAENVKDSAEHLGKKAANKVKEETSF